MSVEKKEIPCLEDGTPLHGDAYFRARNTVIDFIKNYRNPYNSENPDFLEYEAGFFFAISHADEFWDDFMRGGLE